MTIFSCRPRARRGNHETPRLRGLVVALLLGLILTAGCRGKYDTIVVDGTITYGGEKVMNGDIRFYPDGVAGAACGAPIVDGHYEAKNKGGLVVGTHRAVIRAFILEKSGAVSAQAANADLLSGPSPPTGKPALPLYRVEGRDQFIPSKYNAQSQLVADVTGEENPQTIDFNLERVDK